MKAKSRLSALVVAAGLLGTAAVVPGSAAAAVPLAALIQLELAPAANGGSPTDACLDAYYKTSRTTACETGKVHNWAVETVATDTVRLHPANNSPLCLGVTGGTPTVGSCDTGTARWSVVRSTRTDGAFALRSTSNTYLVAGELGSGASLGQVGSNWLAGPPESHSHYVRNIRPDADNAALMREEGCADGTQDTGAAPSQPHAVLLHIGAQTITAPLGADRPGVALTRVSPTVRLTYAQLVTAMKGYLDGYSSCHVGRGLTTVAVATNNDGAWDGPYSDTQRGTDWATQVVAPLRNYAAQRPVPAGTTQPVVVGGFDVEGAFASSEAQAENWTRSYLAHTDADLVTVGSLDACPQSFSGPAACGPVVDTNDVQKTWTLSDYVQLNRSIAPARIKVLPQIFFVSQARQWAVLDQESVAEGAGHLSFLGVLTESSADAGTLAPNQASTAFSALLPAAYGQALPAVTNLSSDE
ncbi:MAG: hypothetical protein JWO88_2130 [Frankiales bacterium]|nr:hypothetical protein [Frankiales bacterium]